MRANWVGVVAAGLVALAGIEAQEIKLPANLEKLSGKAEESVEVTLNSAMLRLVAKFDNDGDAAASRRLLNSLDSVYVRSFQFAWDDDYDRRDVEELRAQFRGPGWFRVVGVRSKKAFDDSDGDVDVYFKDGGNGKLAGIAIISAEPREFTYVQVSGNLQPEQLADLGGQFHIPHLDLAHADLGIRRSR